MPELLKNMYNKEFLDGFAEKVHSVYENFDRIRFINTVIDNTWDQLELKARMKRIAETLGKYLPEEYEEALEILFAIETSCAGFPYLFFPEFVAIYGQLDEHWDLSMKALERFTIKSSAEFAVRPFIMRDQKRMMWQMLDWSKNSNEHVRRLASEGCRSRLPWRESIPIFKHDPTSVISVLEHLKEDPSLYVRKSVANNLNDISKDNPSVILEIIRRWKGINPYTDWILRHGCRTLIRKANPEVMKLFGYEESIDGSLIINATLDIDKSIIKIGESCRFKYEICIREGGTAHIRIEYGIDFVKARGNTSRKLFILSDRTVPGGTNIAGTRMHRWRDLTTRKHYPGEHRIVLLINGCEVAQAMIELDSIEKV